MHPIIVLRKEARLIVEEFNSRSLTTLSDYETEITQLSSIVAYSFPLHFYIVKIFVSLLVLHIFGGEVTFILIDTPFFLYGSVYCLCILTVFVMIVCLLIV